MSTLKRLEGHPNYYKDPETLVIYYRDKVGNKTFTRSTKETAIAQAKAHVRKMLPTWLSADEDSSKKVLQFEWDKYLEFKKTMVGTETHKRIATSGKWLMEFFGSDLPISIDSARWNDYLHWRRKNWPSHSLENDAKWFSNFCHYLADRKIIARPLRIKNPDVRNFIGREYSDDELSRLMERSSADLRLAIWMGYKMMMRIGEIAEMSWDRIDFKRQTLISKDRDSATKIKRVVPINDLVFKVLKDRKLQSKSPWVFPQVRDPSRPIATQVFDKEFQKVKIAAKVKGRFHDLKHTGITRLIRAKKPLPWISKVSGTSIATLMRRYEHTSPEDFKGLVNEIVLKDEETFF